MKKDNKKPESVRDQDPINPQHQLMLEWLENIRFRHTALGGVDEADLWKKLEELNRLYTASLQAERNRYDTLLAEYRHQATEKLTQYRQTVESLKRSYQQLMDSHRGRGV